MIKDIFSYARGTKPEEIRFATIRYKDFFTTRREYEEFCIYAADMVDAVLMGVEGMGEIATDGELNPTKAVDMAYYMWKAHVTPHILFAESVFTQLIKEDEEKPKEAEIDKVDNGNNIVARYKVKKENN